MKSTLKQGPVFDHSFSGSRNYAAQFSSDSNGGLNFQHTFRYLHEDI